MRDLSTIFEPKSIAVIGATSNPRSVTNVTFLRQLIDFGYPGRIYPVNPHADQVLGLKAYASIGDIPEPVDYAVCAIPAPAAPGVMRECVAAKVKVVAMFTAGFSEVGDDGDEAGEGSGRDRAPGGSDRAGAQLPRGPLPEVGTDTRGWHRPERADTLAAFPRAAGWRR